MNPYPLRVINRLINEKLPKEPSTYEELHPLIDELEQETEGIIRNLQEILSTKKNHEAIEIFAQSLQKDLLFLMEKVVTYLPQEEWHRLKHSRDIFESTDAYKTVYNCLEELLSFIHGSLGRYIDTQVIIPVSYLVDAQNSLKISLLLIEKRLEQAAIDPAIKEIVLKPLYDFLSTNAANHNVTYEKMLYLNKLQSNLTEVVDKYGDNEIAEKLHERLVYLNFNDRGYFTNITRLIKTQLEESPTDIIKLISLYELDRYHYLLPVKSGISYKSGGLSLKQSLIEWILKEIALMELRRNDVEAPADNKKSVCSKALLPLSIDEFGYLLYLFYQGDIISKSVVKKHLTAFLSHHISTKGKENISPGSLLKKMSKPEDHVVRSVKRKLEKLIEMIDSNIILLVPLTELVLRMAHENASVTSLTLALLFLGGALFLKCFKNAFTDRLSFF